MISISLPPSSSTVTGSVKSSIDFDLLLIARASIEVQLHAPQSFGILLY